MNDARGHRPMRVPLPHSRLPRCPSPCFHPCRTRRRSPGGYVSAHFPVAGKRAVIGRIKPARAGGPADREQTSSRRHPSTQSTRNSTTPEQCATTSSEQPQAPFPATGWRGGPPPPPLGPHHGRPVQSGPVRPGYRPSSLSALFPINGLTLQQNMRESP
jgi:hypothetical protein